MFKRSRWVMVMAKNLYSTFSIDIRIHKVGKRKLSKILFEQDKLWKGLAQSFIEHVVFAYLCRTIAII